MSGALTHSPADILAQLLVDLGVAEAYTSTSWPVFVGKEPSDPDECITIYDRSGFDNGRVMVGGEKQEHEGFQIRVRGTTHRRVFTKIRAIAVALDQEVENNTVTLSGETYTVHSVERGSDLIPLGTESGKSRLVLFTLNGRIAVTQTS